MVGPVSFDPDVYREAEKNLHVAAVECANAVYDKAGLKAIDLLDAALAYARAVNGGKYGRVEIPTEADR